MLIKTYYKKTNTLFLATIFFVTAWINTNIHAADAVPVNSFNTKNQIFPGETISATGFGLSDTYSDNPFINNSAWGLQGNWYTFRNHNVSDIAVSVLGDAGFAPGLTVWATGESAFNGGTTFFGSEISSAGFGTPHSFNAAGVIGDAGTLWMADGQGGNVIETLGYAVSGPSHFNSVSPTGWGEDIVTGVHDVSITDIYETGVTGSIGPNTASLAFNDLAAGWYTVYVGGTDHSLSGGQYDLVVSAVPEAETWAMLLAGLGLIGWRLKKLQNEQNTHQDFLQYDSLLFKRKHNSRLSVANA